MENAYARLGIRYTTETASHSVQRGCTLRTGGALTVQVPAKLVKRPPRPELYHPVSLAMNSLYSRMGSAGA